MAEPTVSFLLDKVAQVLTYYAKLAADAKYQLELLQNELSLLRSFLKEAEKRTEKEGPVREMEKQIRRTVYEVEDIVDACLTQEIVAVRSNNAFKRAMGVGKRISLAENVKTATEKKVRPMLERANQIMRLPSRPIAQISAADQLRENGEKLQFIRQDNVVGFEEEEKTIIEYLMEVTGELNVISIIGMPCKGKTTLMWKIFHNSKIQFEFPFRIWVNITQEFNKKEVLLNILKVFTDKDMSRLSEPDLIEAVRASLKDEKFLLVMDDVWNDETWNAIKHVLPMNNPMAKVVMTSREKRRGVRLNHELRFLTPEESWKLLQYEVFKGLHRCPNKELENIGKRIACQCCGLALALVVMGGVLLDHYKKEDLGTTADAWESISEDVSAYIGAGGGDRGQQVQKMVEMSYNALSEEQRHCFLYVGVFPEDYEIPAQALIHLWVAEGFVQQKEKQSLEETAEETLKALINRNLLMVEKSYYNGQVKTCRVHDVIREFCKSKAGIEELNLYQEITFVKGRDLYPPASEIHKHRRLCIHSDFSRFFNEGFDEPKSIRSDDRKTVRSFLCFNDEQVNLPANYIATIANNFKLLRVLDSKCFRFPQFPPQITRLIHLRYITLSCHDLTILPEEISNLWNLQTLLVDTQSPTLKVKANIWKMFELRHLKSNVAIILLSVLSEGSKSGRNLQTLTRLSPQHCVQDVFDKACNLKSLGIRGDISLLSDAKHSLEKLIHLNKLKLDNDQENPRGLPRSNFFPPNIKKLTLLATKLDWKHMSTLAEIHTLRALKLKNKAFKGSSWKADHGKGFPRLQYLHIEGTDLASWEISKDHFPVLECLVLADCKKLTEIPLSLAKGLRKLDIDQVPESVVKSIEDMKAKLQGQEYSGKGGLELRVGRRC